jgi:hypothetical protein
MRTARRRKSTWASACKPPARSFFRKRRSDVGDKWSHDYKAISTIGTRDAHADFELVGFETVGGIKTAKIKIAYSESGSDPITMKGTVYADIATGDPVSDDFEATGISVRPVGTKATGVFHDERTDGGPYARIKARTADRSA